MKPEAGDECVLMGNTETPLRQNLISIAATEDGQPRIDILDGVKAKNFNGCLRCRLGKLDGIRSSAFPADKQPKRPVCRQRVAEGYVRVDDGRGHPDAV